MSSTEEKILGQTESICPICLKRIPAQRVSSGETVWLKKSCPEHGAFKTVIWRGTPDFSAWLVPQQLVHSHTSLTQVDAGCPYDCGLCPEHEQGSCCVQIEVTARCNLGCPYCFAGAGKDKKEPSLETIKGWLEQIMAFSGPCNIQLSGGEPTLRDDLPEIIRAGRARGFHFFQLNTNGLRLATDPGFVRELQAAGLSTVFLQFDGTEDDIYIKLRGRPLFAVKKRALAHCAEANLGVILVPTLVPGVNIHNIGTLIRFGLQNLPTVRGVHFQPVSYFGRYPQRPDNRWRITLPEVMRALEEQTGGIIKVENLVSPQANHRLCSFHGDFVFLPEGKLQPLTFPGSSSCCSPGGNEAGTAVKARQFIARRWATASSRLKTCQEEAGAINSWEAFLERVKTHSFTVTAMAFQDVWNLDLTRLRRCYLHVFSPAGRLIPFCAYNLTDVQGRPLYREEC